jgi:hypothetical protein
MPWVGGHWVGLWADLEACALSLERERDEARRLVVNLLRVLDCSDIAPDEWGQESKEEYAARSEECRRIVHGAQDEVRKWGTRLPQAAAPSPEEPAGDHG